MTREHFIALATALRATQPDITASRSGSYEDAFAAWTADVRAVAQVCRSFNPNFDFNRFAEAAGL